MFCAAQKNIFGNLAWPHATVQLEFKRDGAPVKTVTVKAKCSETETLPLFTNKDGVRGEVSSAGPSLSSSCVCKDASGSCMVQRPGLPPAVRRSKLQMSLGRRWSTRGSRCSCWARSSWHQSAATRTTLCRLVRSCPTSAAFEPV